MYGPLLSPAVCTLLRHNISSLTLNGSFEERFARLARADAVMKTGRYIPTDQTNSFGHVIVVIIFLLLQIDLK